jgi:hypothetical protein
MKECFMRIFPSAKYTKRVIWTSNYRNKTQRYPLTALSLILVCPYKRGINFAIYWKRLSLPTYISPKVEKTVFREKRKSSKVLPPKKVYFNRRSQGLEDKIVLKFINTFK